MLCCSPIRLEVFSMLDEKNAVLAPSCSGVSVVEHTHMNTHIRCRHRMCDKRNVHCNTQKRSHEHEHKHQIIINCIKQIIFVLIIYKPLKLRCIEAGYRCEWKKTRNNRQSTHIRCMHFNLNKSHWGAYAIREMCTRARAYANDTHTNTHTWLMYFVKQSCNDTNEVSFFWIFISYCRFWLLSYMCFIHIFRVSVRFNINSLSLFHALELHS